MPGVELLTTLDARREVLVGAVETLLAGKVERSKELLRRFTNGTIGFPRLAVETGIHEKSLHRMLSPRSGDSITAANLLRIVDALARVDGWSFSVRATR